MILTKKALKAINNTPTRLRIALALGIGEEGVKRHITRNSSCLTKFAAIQVIKKETGLTEDQILDKKSEIAA